MTPTLIEAARAALDALGSLIDAQNGPPLIGQADEWDCAMYEANAAIDALRAAIEAAEKAEPLFLLHTGSMYGNERDEYEVEADSGERVDRFCDQHPGQTFPLYLHPPAKQPARQPMTEREIIGGFELLPEALTFFAAFAAGVRHAERHHRIGSNSEESR